jgi:hypothetical protein
MVWILAFLCLGLVAAAGYQQGPVRAGFAFFGLLFGALLAGPLSPLTQRLLALMGFHHPAWSIFAPQVLAFLIVLVVFKIAGQMVHRKIAVFFKYKVDDKTLYRWQRVYSRLGLCVGALNGAFYFILLTSLIYSAGYFTTEAGAADAGPAGARFLTQTRAQLHALKLDRVLATYDMVPPKVYETADTAALILHNPLLLSRLGHYPPCLPLAERPEFKSLANDKELLQLIATQARVMDVIQYPVVHYMLTNSAIVAELGNVLGQDLDDLTNFLFTGQSPKYDPQTILGVWKIDRAATIAQLLKTQHPTPTKLRLIEQDLFPLITGLSLTAMPDHQVILKKPNPNNAEVTVVAAGTWKKEQDAYQVNLPGSLPETSEIEFEENSRLYLPKYNYALAFDKEL